MLGSLCLPDPIVFVTPLCLTHCLIYPSTISDSPHCCQVANLHEGLLILPKFAKCPTNLPPDDDCFTEQDKRVHDRKLKKELKAQEKLLEGQGLHEREGASEK